MEKLTLTLKGEQFNREKNIYLMSQTLSNINSIFEKAYLVLNDRKKMSDYDRELFKLTVKDFKEGSLVMEIGMVMSAIAQTTLLNSFSMNPKDIWEMVKIAYSTLMKILEANRKGEKVVINGNYNIVQLVMGNENLTVPLEAFNLMKRIGSNIENMANLINHKKGFSSVELSDSNIGNLRIDENTKQMFKSTKRIDETVIRANVNMIKIDVESKTGKLKINHSDDNDLIIGEKYDFDFLQQPTVEDYSRLIAQDRDVSLLKEVKFQLSTGQNQIVRLKIINYFI